MNATECIWQNGKLIPWEQATTHVLTHSLHYGSGVFEGIRVYQTEAGPQIFKLSQHLERLFYSAKQLSMRIPYSREELVAATLQTVRANKLSVGYIRPIAYFGYGSMRVVPDDQLPVEVVIACWPWGEYLGESCVDVKTSDYIRIHPRSSVTDAKICGHYVNSILAGLAIRNTKYHEALLLDAEGYVAEGSAENIFIVRDNTIITPPTGTILEGITRNTVIEIAQMSGIPLTQQRITREDVLQADEVFFSGTAVEIAAVRSLDDQLIGDGKAGAVTQRIQSIYADVVRGRVAAFHHALTPLEGALS